jgi:hypothetical protein
VGQVGIGHHEAQRALVAKAAPSARAFSLARAICGCTRIPRPAIEDLLFRSSGRPGRKLLIRYKSFHYQADSWTTPRPVVAKVDHHVGELFPRVGFIITNLPLPNRAALRQAWHRRAIDQGRQAGDALEATATASGQTRFGCSAAAVRSKLRWIWALPVPDRLDRRAWPETVGEERTEGGRTVRKNVGGVLPRVAIRAAGQVFSARSIRGGMLTQARSGSC